jgi:hypothetical protein
MAETRQSAHYCEICNKVTLHIPVTVEEFMSNTANDGVSKGLNTVAKLTGLFGLADRVAGALGRSKFKCTGCAGTKIADDDQDHCFWLDDPNDPSCDKWYPWSMVKKDRKLLDEVRRKYNPTLCA